MSRSVDERVVEMQFNNKDFEKNAQTSLSTLDRLKQSLNLLGTGDALKNIGDVDSSGISRFGGAVDGVAGKFSALEAVAIGALMRIGQQAVDAGERLVKSFTIEPITQGFNEYELKMNSVQTIMAGSGESMETVNKYLEELNEYADKTIYSFSDMTANIGKFTNAGVGLEDAVAAIKGISNEAALSGASAQQASHAMYNFAQALSTGYIQLIDWKSIKNATMDTKEFKEELLKTAYDLGTVRKEGDKFVSTTTNIQGKVSEAFDATSKWDNSLNHQWLTSEVLTKTLARYASETTDVGIRANEAATKVKTFTQMVDTIKEAAGSTWAQTFELIFGNLEQATTLWTNLGAELTNIFVGPAEGIKNLIAQWAEFGGNAFMFEGIVNIWTALKNVIEAVGKAWREVFPPASGKRLAEATRGFRDFTAALIPSEKTIEVITAVFKVFFTVIKAGIDVIKGIASVITNVVTSIVKWVQGNESIQRFVTNLVAAIEKLHRWIGLLRITLTNVFQTIQKNPVFKLLTVHINQLLAPLNKLVGNGSGLLDKASDAMERFLGMKFGEVFDQTKIQEFIEGVIVKKLIPAISEATSVLSSFKEKLIGVFGSFGGGDLNFDTFKEFFEKIKESLKAAINNVISLLQGGGEGLSGLKEKAKNIFAVISEGFKTGLSLIDWGAVLNVAKVGSIAWIVYNISKTISNLKNITDGIGDFKKKLLKVFDEVCGVLQAYQNNLNASALLKVAGSIGILAASLIALTFVDSAKLATAAVSLGIVGAVLVGLVKAIGALGNNKKQTDAASTALSSFSESIKYFTDKVGKKVAFASIVVALSVAVAVLVGVVKILSKTPWEEGVNGCKLLGIIMAELTAAMFALSKINGGLNLKRVATTLLALSLAIMALVVPLKLLNENDWDAFGIVALTLGALAGSVWLIGKAGAGSLKGAAALMVLSIALNMLVPSMLLVGAHAESAANGLKILGIALAGLLIGGAIADKVAVGLAILDASMLAIGGTVLMVGAGMALAGASFLLASMGVEKLAKNLGPLADSIVQFATTLNANNDAILQFARNILNDLAVAFDEAIPKIAVLVAKLMMAVLTAIVEHTEEIIGGIMRVIVSALTFLEEEFVPLTDRIVNLVGLLILDVADAIVNATEVFGNAIKYVTDALILVLVEGIEGILTSILGAIPGIGPAASAAIHEQGLKVTSGIRSDMDAIRGVMEEKAKEVGDAIPDTMSAAIAEGQPKVQGATKMLSEISDEPIQVSRPKIRKAGEDIPNDMAEGITSNASKVSTATSTLSDQVTTGITAKTTDFNLAGQRLMGEEGFAGGMNLGLENINTNVLGELSTMMDTKFGAMPETFFGYGSNMFGETGFGGGIAEQIPVLDTQSTEFLNSEKTKFEDSVPEFKDLGERTIGNTEGYGLGFLNMEDDVVQSATEVKDGAVTELETGTEEARSAGEASAEGFAQGIRSKIDSAVQAAKALAAAAWSAAKAEIQVNSPSKKFAWLGEQSDAGFAQGLIESTYLVEDASVGMARSAVNAMGQALADANDYITDTIDVNPTITPVMDLSNIQDGIGQINSLVGNRLVTPGVGLSMAYSPNSSILSAINGLSKPNNTANINVYVTGGDNANASEIADEVINRINIEYQRQRAVWA